jgi:hypothetical protein
MGRLRKVYKESAARARTGRETIKTTDAVTNLESEIECTTWDGGVNFVLSDSEDDGNWSDSSNTGAEWLSESDDELEELQGPALMESLHKQCEKELGDLKKLTGWEGLLQPISAAEWKQAQSNRGFGYNKLSKRRDQDESKRKRETEETNKKVRER